MGILESKIEKIQKILEPKKKIIIFINYSTDEKESWLEVNKIKLLIPPEATISDFIQEKTRNSRGIVVCSIYLGQDKILTANVA